jgi:hypothetical protein
MEEADQEHRLRNQFSVTCYYFLSALAPERLEPLQNIGRLRSVREAAPQVKEAHVAYFRTSHRMDPTLCTTLLSCSFCFA